MELHQSLSLPDADCCSGRPTCGGGTGRFLAVIVISLLVGAFPPRVHGQHASGQAFTDGERRAEALKAAGKSAEAVKERQKLLAMALQLYGRNHARTAACSFELAEAYGANAEIERAEFLYKQSLDIRMHVHGPKSLEAARAMGSLSGFYDQIGQYQKAEELTLQALERFTALGWTGFASLCRSNLGLSLAHQDRHKEAVAILERELQYRIKNYGTRSKEVSTILYNLAASYDRLGQCEKAEQSTRRAIQIRESHGERDHSQWDMLLAEILFHEGKYDESGQIYRRSISYADNRFGKDSHVAATLKQSLAKVYAVSGRWAEASDLLDAGERVQLPIVKRIMGGLPELQQTSFALEFFSLHTPLSFGVARRHDQRSADLSASWLLNGKAILNELMAERALLTRDITDPKLVPLVDKLRDVRRRLAELANKEGVSEDDRRRRMSELLGTESDLSHTLALAGGRAAESTPWVELNTVRKVIPEDGVLIEIARVSVFDFAAKGGPAGFPPPTDRYAAWIIPPAGKASVTIVDFGDAAAIDASVAKLQDSLRLFQSELGAEAKAGRRLSHDRQKSLEEEFRRASDPLMKLILDPLLKSAGSFSRWILSPDDRLWLVPWISLPLPDGRYLIEGHTLSYVVSGRELVRDRGPQVIAPTPPLIMADPDYDLDVIKAGEETRKLVVQPATKSLHAVGIPSGIRGNAKRLKETADEARAILPTLNAYAKAEPQLYLQERALEGVFKSARSPKVAVLSTHGFFNPVDEKVFRPGANLLMENPLLRCGLLLASANRTEPRPENEDDGTLTGLEIVGCDLRGTDLVVLSACQTGLGDVHAGQSAAGLRQAFQLAGARTVVASLWSVPSLETVDLTDVFFKNLADGKPRSDALRNSQLALLTDLRKKRGAAHPFYWGTFTLTGDWK